MKVERLLDPAQATKTIETSLSMSVYHQDVMYLLSSTHGEMVYAVDMVKVCTVSLWMVS